MKIACLLLAAGKGARFGGRKQLANINGLPMVHHTLAELLPIFGDHIYTVLGAYLDEVGPVVERVSKVLEHKDWQLGIGSSIAFGVSEIVTQQSYDGVLIALADQVAIKQADYERLIKKFDGHSIIASQYANRNAVPALFPKADFAKLTGLTGDRGAQKILNENKASIISIALPRAEQDIDTPNDLVNFWLENHGSEQISL